MSSGEVVTIFIHPKHREPMIEVEQANAVAACGIEGDAYFRAPDSGKKEIPDAQITLIESEALDALLREYDVELQGSESRRNVLTRGVALNHLVGKEFRVGEAVLRGMRLCEPCSHLEGLTRAGVLKGLIHRGGLRAQIVQGGVIKRGDVISV